MTKGQVSSEYLVVMAIVLIIALTVVFLLRDFLITGAGISESQSRSYWSVASPFSISAQKYSNTLLQMDMQNALSETVTITSIQIEGTVYTVSETFRIGEERIVDVTLGSSCGSLGDPYSLEDIVINYQRGGTTASQTGSMPLVGTCS